MLPPHSISSASILLAAVLLGGAAVVNAEHGAEMRRQGGMAGGARGHGGDVDKRQGSNARMTYYYTDVGPGACGQVHQNNEYTVAMNTAQFNNGGVCGQTITINYNGNSATALIADECPSCGYGQLDLSPGLFQHFADFGAGEIYGSWGYGSGAPAPEPTPTKTKEPEPTPTTTKRKKEEATSTTSTTPEPEPTTSSSTSEYVAPTTSSAIPTSSDLLSSEVASTTSASVSASATPSAPAGLVPQVGAGQGNEGVLVALGQAVAGLGGMVCKGNGGCVAAAE